MEENENITESEKEEVLESKNRGVKGNNIIY